jgi:biotin carboxylase
VFDCKNKKLLVLGGTSASVDLVKTAKKMGVYTIVTDDQDFGVAKEIADETLNISTTDISALARFVKSRKIDGVFCGPSEFNIRNAMKVAHLSRLPFYATEEQWNICSNKESFKELCREFSVPCVFEYDINNSLETETLEHIDYPVIVKPVDGCSSKGIEVCYSEDQLKKSYENAIRYSNQGRVMIEQYIDNGGIVTSVRYIACKGELYLSLTGDTYIVDPINRSALISALTVYPSKYTSHYVDNIDPKVREMFKSIGFKNGVLFMQSLPLGNELFFHEMGLRLSGGLTYTITEAANQINDLEMMIRYALGGSMCSDDEINRIDPLLDGRLAASLCIPLKTGKIAKLDGVEEIMRTLNIENFAQYYNVGDQVSKDSIGTLMQHFGRFKFFANSMKELIDTVNQIQKLLIVEDKTGHDLIYAYFDTDRLR